MDSRKVVSCGGVLWRTTRWMEVLPDWRRPMRRIRGGGGPFLLFSAAFSIPFPPPELRTALLRCGKEPATAAAVEAEEDEEEEDLLALFIILLFFLV